MVQLYIEYLDNEYYLLDLDEDESVNFKLTVKDLSDISRIFSPFTQSFNIKATDKNKRLCGFIGNEKIQSINNSGKFNAKVYVAGFLFESGILSFDETDYEFNDQTSFKTNFASNLTGLKEKLGDTTIQSLFDINDPAISVTWDNLVLAKNMSSFKTLNFQNGISLKYAIPFISNKRVLTYNEADLNIVDNVAFNKITTPTTSNKVVLNEVRPAIDFMSIMKHLLLKIETPVICPLFEKPEVKDLFAWCNSESLIVKDINSFNLENFKDFNSSRYNFKQDNNAVNVPSLADTKWLITKSGNSFKVKRNNITSGEQGGWSDGFDVYLNFNALTALDSEIKIKVNLVNAITNIVIDSQEVSGSDYSFRILDPRSQSPTMLDSNGELFIRFEILPLTLVKWNYIEVKTIQKFNYTRKVGLSNRTARADYSHVMYDYTDSKSLGGNVLNLINTLPKIKCEDFLRSFFKTFNIMVVSTGLPDRSMYWLTPDDLKEINKGYSKRTVDYTRYTDISTLNKKRGNEYNQYIFSHFNSKYYDSKFVDGTYFGSLTYPEVTPTKPTKYEIKTDFSIIKQANRFTHPSGLRTCYGFSVDAPTTQSDGSNIYKSVFEEFTIFYLNQKTLNSNTVGVAYLDFNNAPLFSAVEASYKNYTNGKTLSFGANDTGTDSLYLNYYDDFIELLLNPNTYKSEFQLFLPSDEIFLNFSNQTQGESNIPTGFRAQNDIIIGEQRYQLMDSSIDLTTGKAKLTLLNY